MLPREISRHRFDVDEYQRMGEVGLFTGDCWVELIRGEIVGTKPTGVAHISVVDLLNRSVATFAAESGLMVSVQNPVRLDEDNESEPDIAFITAGPRTEFPSPSDTSLIIEVSDTTLAYDRNVKLPLYAETGILEVWIVDLESKKVEVHSEPSPEGYEARRVFTAGEIVKSATLDGLTVSVDEVLA